MAENKTEQHTAARQRSKGLSPELNEFLHMLEALEKQLSADQPAVIRARAA